MKILLSTLALSFALQAALIGSASASLRSDFRSAGGDKVATNNGSQTVDCPFRSGLNGLFANTNPQKKGEHVDERKAVASTAGTRGAK